MTDLTNGETNLSETHPPAARDEIQQERGVSVVSRHPNLVAVAFGLALTCVLLGGLEGVFRALLAKHRAASAPAIREDRSGIANYSPEFGYEARTGVSPCRYYEGDRLIREVNYSVDDVHRRIAFGQDDPNRKQAALFFGCSFTFGEGLEDNETIPSFFARSAPGWRAYNYAFMGYGPQNAYLLAGSERVERLGGATPAVAIYVYMDDHLNRAIGRLSMIGSKWSKNLPCLEMDDGRLVNRGRFRDAWPWRRRLAMLIESSALLTAMRVDWPAHYRPCDYEFVATILDQTKNALHAKFPDIRFYVLIYPNVSTGNEIAQRLRQKGVEVLDYSHLFDTLPVEPPLWLDDGHPAKRAAYLVATQIVKDTVRTPKPAPKLP